MPKIKDRLEKVLNNKDIELVELFFGIQAMTTSLTSIIFEHDIYICFLLITNGLIAIPQILAVVFEKLEIRHWSNILTAITSILISTAIAISDQESNQIAIVGYLGLGIACIFCSYRTDIEIRIKKQKSHGRDNTSSR